MPESKIEISAVSGASLVKTRPVFGPDSKCIFCCSESLIKVFSTESGECIRNLHGHTNTVTGIVVNPNNKLQILSCSFDQSVIQWDYSDGVLLKVYQLHYPLHDISLSSHQETPVLILKRQTSRQEYDIIECVLPSQKDCAPKINVLLGNVNKEQCSMAVGCQNKVIATINETFLYVQNQKKKVRHTLDNTQQTEFTCVACHPTDVCVVTGCQNGRIYYWYNIFRKEKVVKTYHHWHALPVLDLCFTVEGSYLLSGGHECVLVKWQYNSDQKDFLPRLGAPINRVTCSHDNMYYATCHTDNVIKLITNKFDVKQVYQGLTCAHLSVQKTHPVPAGLHYDPRSKALVTNGKIGHLQFYSVTNDKHLYDLDIVGQNYISPENMAKPLTVTEVMAADFSCHGDWLATVELWDDHVMSPELRLKFWQFREETRKYTLNTTVELPHNFPVTCLKIRPETGEDDDQPMAVTTSLDNYFKTWTLVDDTNIYRKNKKWMCKFSGYYRYSPASTAAYSDDGSLLCVGFGSVLTIWDPDTNVLLQTLAGQKDKSDVQFIEFGKYSCSHLLTACSENSLVTWNLSSCTVLWNIDFSSVSLISDPETDVMAVISETSDVYFFRPSSPDILYHQNTISSSKVASAVFIPQHQGRQSLTALEKGRQLPTKSKLYFINSDHQLLCLSEVDTAVTAPKTMFTIQQNLPQTTLSLLLSKENTKQPAVDSRSTSKDIKSWKGFLDTPPQVQPAVTSLCKQFVQSMLVKSGTNSGNIEDDEELSDEECVMEVDDDVDSDEDVISQGKSQNMKNKNTKPKDSIKQTVIHTDTRAKDDYVSYMDWYIKR